MFGIEPIVDGEILLHVGEEDGDVDDIVPGSTGVFQHETHIFKYGATLLLDVVTDDVTGGVELDAGNFLATANAGSDSGKEEQVSDTLGMWKCADWFGRASFRMFRSLTWRVFLKFWQFGIHRVPRLRICCPDVVLRFIHTRVVQSPGSDALSEFAFTAEQS